MTEHYLHLPQKEQEHILTALSSNPNIQQEAHLLEKDIWICWVLEHLFNMPNRLPMAFKGGTSLSKVFGAINRFSEDVDITIDYQAFTSNCPFDDSITKSKLKTISATIKGMVTQHIRDVIAPYFENLISETFTINSPSIALDEDGETLHLKYPSVIERKSGYVSDTIRLEFGGRNLTIPNNIYTVKADISEYLPELVFPISNVTVLSPQKTFWEKITLMHYECHRPTLKLNADRISRHWYDIIMLMNHEIGQQALENRDLLTEVIKIKKAFYDSSYANYDKCLTNDCRLIPSDDYLELLRQDFNIMLREKMFYGEQPNFDEIMRGIKALENIINRVR